MLLAVKHPCIHTGDIQKVEKNAQVPFQIFTPIGVRSHTLIQKISTSHAGVANLDDMWTQDLDDFFFSFLVHLLAAFCGYFPAYVEATWIT